MSRYILIKKYFTLLLITCLFKSLIFPNENKLFWDGSDWNRIDKSVDNSVIRFKIKSAYLNGALDGRLNYYLKTWMLNNNLADEAFAETVDYLTIRELIKNLDYFYEDPLNSYIPITSAILIANMYANRVPIDNINLYINNTRKWINNLILDLDTLNYHKLLDEKLRKNIIK